MNKESNFKTIAKVPLFAPFNDKEEQEECLKDIMSRMPKGYRWDLAIYLGRLDQSYRELREDIKKSNEVAKQMLDDDEERQIDENHRKQMRLKKEGK